MQGISTPAEVPAITPFWQRLPHFFRYPLHVEPLLYMVVLALATLLGFILPLPSPLDHLIVHLGVWLAFIRYAYKTLDQTSLGLLTPEQHRFYDAKERANLPYKQFAIFLVSGFAISLAGFLGNVAVGLMMVFFVLAMPASIMILSITQSFRAGLNPFAAVGMMRVIGLPYLGLCAFLFLLSSSQGILQMELVPRVPEWLMIPTLNFVAMYFTLIMFNMMGYVVYQYHALLGVEISASAPASGPTATPVDAIGALIAAGQIDEAVDMAYEAQRAAPDDQVAHGRYHKLLLLAGRRNAPCRMRATIFPCSCRRGGASRRSISTAKCRRASHLRAWRSRPSGRNSSCGWPKQPAVAASTRRRSNWSRASTSASRAIRKSRRSICLPPACCARTCARMLRRAGFSTFCWRVSPSIRSLARRANWRR